LPAKLDIGIGIWALVFNREHVCYLTSSSTVVSYLRVL